MAKSASVSTLTAMSGVPVTIRPAVVDDLPAVAEVHIASRNAYWSGLVPDADLEARAALLRDESYTPEKLSRPGYTLLVAEGSDSLVGIALLGPPQDADADPSRVGELWQIHVKPAYWRQGVGSRLHDTCVAIWRGASITEGRVEVWEHNTRACAFYSRHGWDLDGPTRPAVNGSRFLRLRLHLRHSR